MILMNINPVLSGYDWQQTGKQGVTALRSVCLHFICWKTAPAVVFFLFLKRLNDNAI